MVGNRKVLIGSCHSFTRLVLLYQVGQVGLRELIASTKQDRACPSLCRFILCLDAQGKDWTHDD
jgi:hypothetical protein